MRRLLRIALLAGLSDGLHQVGAHGLVGLDHGHGEAVAVGIALSARLAVRLGVLSTEDAERIERRLLALGFSLTPPQPIKRLAGAISKDKKSDGDALHFVLPTGIGSCEVRRMAISEIAKLAEEI